MVVIRCLSDALQVFAQIKSQFLSIFQVISQLQLLFLNPLKLFLHDIMVLLNIFFLINQIGLFPLDIDLLLL